MSSSSSISLYSTHRSEHHEAYNKPKACPKLILLFMSVLAASCAEKISWPEKIESFKRVSRMGSPRDAVLDIVSSYLGEGDSRAMRLELDKDFGIPVISPLEWQVLRLQNFHNVELDFAFHDRLVEQLLTAEERAEKSEICLRYPDHCEKALSSRRAANLDSFIEDEIAFAHSGQSDPLTLALSMDENSLNSSTDVGIETFCAIHTTDKCCRVYKTAMQEVQDGVKLCNDLGLISSECKGRLKQGKDEAREKLVNSLEPTKMDHFFKTAAKERQKIEKHRLQIQTKNMHPHVMHHR